MTHQRFDDLLKRLSDEDKNLVSSKMINLDKYQNLDSEIGKGAFGHVFIVQDKETNVKYAAKKIYWINEDDFRIEEILIPSRVNYPNLLQIVGFSPVDFSGRENPIIFTKYMEKGSVNSFYSDENKRDNEKLFIILLGIAIGMKHLHSKNVAHRDLKPENILLDENFFPIIADFGLSKIAQDTLLRSQVGTPYYMAPEVFDCEDDDSYSTSADVYSYAIIAYQLLSGKPPYDEGATKGLFDLFRKVQLGLRPNLDKLDPKLVIPKQFLEMCWSACPASRPTFSEIIDYLLSKNFYGLFVDRIDRIIEYLEIFNDEFNEQIERLIEENPQEVHKHVKKIVQDEDESDYYTGSSADTVNGKSYDDVNNDGDYESYYDINNDGDDESRPFGLTKIEFQQLKNSIDKSDWEDFIEWLNEYKTKPKSEIIIIKPEKEEYINKNAELTHCSKKVIEIMYDYSESLKSSVLVLSGISHPGS